MQTRFVIRTHREISHPGIFTALIRECTTPYKSMTKDSVAKRLHYVFRNSQHHLSYPGGANYAVDMAQKFGFLTSNGFWDWRGWVINGLAQPGSPEVPVDYLTLTLRERTIYLKYYLESQGALILIFSKLLLDRGELSDEELSKEPYIDQIFIDIWDKYWRLSSQLKYRVELKNRINQLEQRPYSSSTRPHKYRPIIGALIDLGLLEQDDETFRPIHLGSKMPLQVLVDELRDIEQMEIRFKRFDYYEIIARCFETDKKEPADIHQFQLGDHIRNAYYHLKSEETGLASLKAIVDFTAVEAYCSFGHVVSRQEIMQLLESRRSKSPYKVRFHINRRGERAYVVIDPEAF
jgi:hypothetical protein